MPRLAIVDPARDSGPGADILNGPLKEKQINIFKGLAAHPAVLQAFLGFVGGVKSGAALTAKEAEIVALACAEKRNCRYCRAAHTAIARGAGIDEEAALAIRRGRAADDRHQALLDFTNAIIDADGFVSDEELAAFRAAGFDDRAAIETVAHIAINTFTNFYNNVNETEVDFPEPATV